MLSYANPNMQGNVGLGSAIGYYTSKGFIVSVPLTDSQAYDLVVDDKTNLYTVQVKTTRYKRNGNYNVQLSVKGGNKTGTGKVKIFDKSKVDLIFILTNTGDKYSIPTNSIDARHQLVLTSYYAKYKIS